MKRINAGLWLLAAVTLATFVACGDPGPNDGGSGCTSDSSCGTGKMCHPLLKTCLPTCTGGSDCPSTAKTCRTFSGRDPGDAGTELPFCQCSTTALCGASTVACMANTHTCENKCTSNSGCWGGTCNTTTGECSGGGGGGDGGTDGGASCSYNPTAIPPSEVRCTGSAAMFCNWATNQCVAPAACSGASQPGTCGYGAFCGGSACDQIHMPTCANFTPPGGATPTWTPVSTGPIIWKIDTDSSPATANCFKGFFNHSMYINAYRTDADFPTQLSALGGIFYIDGNGGSQDLTAGLPGSYYVRDGTNARQMRLRVYLCAKTATAFSAGYRLTNGNESCPTTTGGTAGTTNCTGNGQCGGGGWTCNTGTGVCGP